MDQDFGKHLQKARTDRGLSIEQAAAAVRIRSTFLRALESSDLTKFPNAAYAKSFLLMYGRYLGVDLKSVAAQIDTSTQMKVEGYQYLTNRAEQPKAKAEPEMSFSMAPEPKSSGSWLPLLVLGGTVFVAVIGFILWSNMNRLGERPPAPPAKEATPVVPVEPLTKIPTPTPAAAPQAAADAPPRPAVISTAPDSGSAATPETEIPRARAISPVGKIAATDSDLLADMSPPKPRVISRSPATPTTPPPRTAPPVAEEEDATPAADANATVLEPKRKSWVIIRTGPGGQVLFEDYLYPAAKPLRLPAGRYFIELRDSDAVEITHKGQRIGYSSPGVVVE